MEAWNVIWRGKKTRLIRLFRWALYVEIWFGRLTDAGKGKGESQGKKPRPKAE